MATSFPGPTVLFINSPSGKSGTGDPGIPVLYVLDSGSMDKNKREELIALFIMIIIITIIRRASGSLVDHRGELRTSCLPGVECELLCHSAILFRRPLTTLYYLLWKHILRLVHLPQKPAFDMAFIKEPDVDNRGASGHISVPLKRQKQICQTPYFWYACEVICFEASQSIGGCPNNISSCGRKPLTYTCGLIFGSTVQRSTPTENSAPL